MATAPTDQQRSTLLATALFAVALAIFAARAIKDGRNVEALPVPATNLEALSSFMSPLVDTSRVGSLPGVAAPVRRDPFITNAIAAPRAISPMTETAKTATAPVTVDGPQWIVSTILIEGSKKSAIVNNAWVTVGDSLGGGSRLTAVERDHIVVTDAKGIRHTVPIQGGESW